MANIDLFKPFVIAIILGSLLGLERAFSSKDDSSSHELLGGMRTFSLIALSGCMASFIERNYFPGFLSMFLAGLFIITALSYGISFYKHNEGGITTEISILICFGLGILLDLQYSALAIFLAVIVAMILHLKQTTIRLTSKLESEDIRAVLKFAIITFIILPLFESGYVLRLGDLKFLASLFKEWESLIRLEIINPRQVWYMVVLISGIGFTGYISIKILGSRKGIGFTGILGGIASSTATTLNFSKRSRETDSYSMAFSLALILACTIMFPRILIEVLIINPHLLPSVSVPVGCMALGGFIYCFILWRKTGESVTEEVPLKNPFNITPAITFGLVYAGIILLVRIVHVFTGSKGIYLLSILSGLTDVDPITLSMSQIAGEDPSLLVASSIAITLAAISNTTMKALLVILFGSAGLKRTCLAGFAVILFSGIAGLILGTFIFS